MTINEMLKIMREPVSRGRLRTFSISYLTADRSRKKGGEYRTIERARLKQFGGKSGNLNDRTLRIELSSGDVITIHLDTILFFNNTPVA